MITPLVQEISYQDPLRVFSLFAGQSGAVFLDSAQKRESCGRYSFIALDPFQTLSSKNGAIQLGGHLTQGNPFMLLEEQLALFPLERLPNLPLFQGGVAGYFGYDLCQHLEKITPRQSDDMQFPDLLLGFYDLVIGFDLDAERAWIFSSGLPVMEKEARESRAKKRLQWLQTQLAGEQSCALSSDTACDLKAIQSNFTSLNYQDAVRKVRDYILAGDIFEANISQRFQVDLPSSLTSFELYQRLRLLNPAPFAAYLNFEEVVIASASPERFLQLQEQAVEARPIKGTRPRGKTKESDQAFAHALLNSEKDHAENVMIVDLLRNDLSRVCKDHSVQVTQLCGLESYATVHHLVSVVTGVLQNDADAVDLLRAAFPGGSITGAPKVRAMEIIAEIEPHCRGPYCGSVGYINFNGDMDTSIIIRTFAIHHNKLTFQAGGAVVADSDPLSEYEETLTKIRALQTALTEALIIYDTVD